MKMEEIKKCETVEEFLEQVPKLKKGEIIVLDERLNKHWDNRFKEVKESKDIEKANKLLDEFEKEINLFFDDLNKLEKFNK